MAKKPIDFSGANLKLSVAELAKVIAHGRKKVLAHFIHERKRTNSHQVDFAIAGALLESSESHMSFIVDAAASGSIVIPASVATNWDPVSGALDDDDLGACSLFVNDRFGGFLFDHGNFGELEDRIDQAIDAYNEAQVQLSGSGNPVLVAVPDEEALAA